MFCHLYLCVYFFIIYICVFLCHLYLCVFVMDIYVCVFLCHLYLDMCISGSYPLCVYFFDFYLYVCAYFFSGYGWDHSAICQRL